MTPILRLALLLSSVCVAGVLEAADLGPTPEIFAPGVISGPANDGAPTFTPDGATLYFTRSGANGLLSVILESHRKGNTWTEPTLASFSGEWYDSSASLAKDGSYVVFQSARPSALDSKTPRPSHLWRCDRKGDGWGAPYELPTAVNLTPLVYRPSVGADGSVYFISKDSPDKKFRMYVSEYKDGAYQPAHPLPFSDGTAMDVDPEISNDASYLLFASTGRAPYKDEHEHLYIVHRNKDGWGSPEPMRYQGDTWYGITVDDDPRLSPDNARVYFISDRSKPFHYPLTREQTRLALKDTEWDNGNINVWSMPMDAYVAPNAK